MGADRQAQLLSEEGGAMAISRRHVMQNAALAAMVGSSPSLARAAATKPGGSSGWRIFDMHHHVESAPEPRADGSYDTSQDLPVRKRNMARWGIGASILMARQNYRRTNGIADTRRQNDYVGWYCRNHSELFPVGAGSVEPTYGLDHGIAEIRRMKHDLGLDAVVFHTYFQGRMIDDPTMVGLVRELASLKMPAMVHMNVEGLLESEPYLESLASQVPEATIVAIGAFQRLENIHALRSVGRNCPNVLFDTSLYWQKGRALESYVEEFGADRVVFGTDANANDSIMYNYPSGLIDILEAPRLSEEDRRKILWGNAARLFPVLQTISTHA
jgi:predicted TIM-barrel fold metal-dependent hydrolase